MRAPDDPEHTVTVDGDVDRIRAERRRLASKGPASARCDRDFERVSLPEHDGDVLRDLLAAEGVGTVVEVGLAYGASALAIAEALASTGHATPQHLIIDAHQDQFGDVGWDVLAAAGLGETCTLLRERSQIALPRLLSEGYVTDAAFVDGSHVFHNVFLDLSYLRHIVRPGGLVVLDDCDWPSVATAVRYFEVNTGWVEEDVAARSRLRAYRLPDPPVEPGFEDFQPFA